MTLLKYRQLVVHVYHLDEDFTLCVEICETGAMSPGANQHTRDFSCIMYFT